MSILVLGVAFVMLGSGTFSYFSDTESATDNTFTAGTIDIQIGENDPWTGSFQLEEAKPCQTRYIDFDITNVGMNPCVIWKHVKITAEEDNLQSEPEQDADGYNINNIGNWILYDLVVDGEVIFCDEDGLTLRDIHCMWMPLGTLQPKGEEGDTMHVTQSYHLKPETGNGYQGDMVTFDISLFAQQRLGDGPQQKEGSKKLFLDDKTGEPDWYFIADGRWAILDWTDGADSASLYLHGMDPITDYRLITYTEPWPGTPATKIVDVTTDGDGYYYSDSVDISGIGAYSGKIWLVLVTDHDDANNEMSAWSPMEYLYESNLVTI